MDSEKCDITFSFLQMVLEQLAIHLKKKIELQSIPCTRYKINSNWIPDISIKSKTKKQRENLGDLGLGKDFLGSVPKAQFESTKKNKLKNWTLSKLKTLLWENPLLRG